MARIVWSGLIACVGLLLVASPGFASDGNPGRAAYFRYCSACHGADGTGNGEVAGSLHPRPTNLTQLAKTHGGTFPADSVRASIDGRARIAAHGDARMPVWGRVFGQEDSWETPEAHAQSLIQLLTTYLASIQRN
jgi:mono/diheme cytochrome c family protein